jgi:hypothetical protein
MKTFIMRFVGMAIAAALGTFLGLMAFMATMVLIELF